MKKSLVFLVALILSTSLALSADWFKLTQINIKPENCEWSGWIKCEPEPLDICFDYDRKEVTIFSKTKQIINYIELDKDNYTDYYTLTGYATDSNYKTIVLSLYFYNDGTVFLNVRYKDVEYMYVVN